MDFNNFIGKLYEAAGPSSSKLEDVLKDKKKWKYCPKQSWDSGTMKVIVEEENENKWITYFLKPKSKLSDKAKAAAKAELEGNPKTTKESSIKEILRFQSMLTEAASAEGGGMHGDTGFTGDGWEIAKEVSLDFEGTLKGCVYLVTEKGGQNKEQGFSQAAKK